jgi:hypothetical protein
VPPLPPTFLPEDGSKASFRNVVFKEKHILGWIKSKSKILRVAKIFETQNGTIKGLFF